MISSQNALLYAYAFYLIGRLKYKAPEHKLQKAIGRWFFFCSLNRPLYKLSGNSDGRRPQPLEELQWRRSISFDSDSRLENELTKIEFGPQLCRLHLKSSSARNPELFAFVAAQNRLGAPVLFSHKKISDLIDPALRTKKKSLERHHLFPRAWLEKSGEADLKIINQMANYALLEWPENISISDDPPSKYVDEIRPRFGTLEWQLMNELHALPEGWEMMSYELLAR